MPTALPAKSFAGRLTTPAAEEANRGIPAVSAPDLIGEREPWEGDLQTGDPVAGIPSEACL
jgi:hypothetical protein